MGIVIKVKAKKPAKLKPESKQEIARKKLVALVEQTIAEKPRERDGFLWAERFQAEWAELMGVSVATFRRIISEPPFERDRAHSRLGSKIIVTLLRIGDGTPVKKTPLHIANIMRSIFLKKTGRKPNRHAFGCVVGLAEVWPDGQQIEIFSLVINDWLAFMAGFRLRLETGEIAPPVKKTYAKPVPYMKLNHPHIPTIRLGAAVAVELYEMRLQEQQAHASLKKYEKSDHI